MSHGYRQLYSLYQKTKGIYVDISKYVEARFDTSNNELDRPLPKGKIKNNWVNERWNRLEIIKIFQKYIESKDI